ncbi:MAG: hypothetical protein ACKO38_04325, partial [Planctomycetota bacterium]
MIFRKATAGTGRCVSGTAQTAKVLASPLPVAWLVTISLVAASGLGALGGVSTTRVAAAGDWPMYRCDAQRSGATPAELPARLSLAWSLELPVLQPAWPDQPKMQLDSVYEPVVLGRRLFVGSSHDDSLTAYDTRSGRELWRFHA